MQLTILGHIHSPIKDRDSAPKMEDEGAPQAHIILHEDYLEAAADLAPGQELDVVTWLDRADRGRLSVHPRGDVSRPKRGVFATRSPDRPNPLGIHRVTILELDGLSIGLDHIEALDGTPVVDIKPAVYGRQQAGWGQGINIRAAEDIRAAGERGWQRGLYSGWNGNISRRDGDVVHITRSGSTKGQLVPGDILKVDLEGTILAGTGKSSMETFMHLGIYKAIPQARAVAHTHPPQILALGFQVPFEAMLALPLYEAGVFRQKMAMAPALEPGSMELAQAVAQAAATVSQELGAVYMESHGLICWGRTLADTMALSEELEALARIQLCAAVQGGCKASTQAPS